MSDYFTQMKWEERPDLGDLVLFTQVVKYRIPDTVGIWYYSYQGKNPKLACHGIKKKEWFKMQNQRKKVNEWWDLQWAVGRRIKEFHESANKETEEHFIHLYVHEYGMFWAFESVALGQPFDTSLYWSWKVDWSLTSNDQITIRTRIRPT